MTLVVSSCYLMSDASVVMAGKKHGLMQPVRICQESTSFSENVVVQHMLQMEPADIQFAALRCTASPTWDSPSL